MNKTVGLLGLGILLVLTGYAEGAKTSLETEPVPVSTPAPVARLALEPEMVRIPGGCFLMGSPLTEAEREKHELPHQVCIKDFEIGRYEVTEKQWQAAMGVDPSRFRVCPDCPVIEVSWIDLQDYLSTLNARTNGKYRLPTEAEWEYACRGGIAGQRYCGGEKADRVAWHDGNSSGKLHPVGKKVANRYGLYDMSGNVSEWTCSSYDPEYGGAERECAIEDTGSITFAFRVVRGGSWLSRPAWVRSAYRYSLYITPHRIKYLGFRLARSY